MPRFSDPERLTGEHDLTAFDCGVPSLDNWLKHHGVTAAAVGSARPYVMTDAQQDGRVVGYHAMTASAVTHEQATERAKAGMPRHPIPAVLLSRLAIDRTVQGLGVGAWLLRDVMLRTVTVAEEVGVRVLLVHAFDDNAQGFYKRHGLEASPTDPLNLQIIVRDIMATLRGL